MNHKNTSIDPKEIEKFSALAKEWWDEQGSFKPLHKLNPSRLRYLRDKIISHFKLDSSSNQPLTGIKLIDIGCGGGLIAEPMKRMGAEVSGIDASEKNIKVALTHSRQMDLEINYICTSVEQLAEEDEQFDVILALEVIEHVDNVETFIEGCLKLLRPGGLIIFSTINRTIKSYLLAIIGAEYILRWLPRGTHSWDKFLKPSEIVGYLRPYNLNIMEIKGITYNPFNDSWNISDDIDVNYFLCATK